MHLQHKYLGIGYVLAAAMCFGTGSIIIKSAYEINLTGSQFITIQLLFSSIILVGIYGIQLWRKKERPLGRAMIWKMFLLGVFGTLSGGAFYNLCLVYIDASVGIVLFYTYPVFTAIGAAVFFKEKLRGKHYFCLVLTIVGMVCTVDLWNVHLADVSLLGIILVTLSSLGYTFFNLYGQKNLADCSSLAITTYTQVFAFLVFSLIRPPLFLLEGLSWYAVFLGVLMAVFTSVLSYWLLLKGIEIIGASKASIVSTSEIPFVIVMAMLILGENLTIFRVIGAALIVGSIIFLDIEDRHDSLMAHSDECPGG